MNKKIRLSKPYLGNEQELINLIKLVLDTGFFIQGEYVAKFENMIADYLGVKYAIAVNSGTAALHLSLIAAGIGPGDEVIVPSYTFPATANVVELVGAKPVFVDVSLETYNIQIEQIERVISHRTKAIIPVHLFGNPVDMDPILDISKKYNLKVIEDAAGALGSTYKNKKCGTIGDLGCFSFHPRKIITTGEGGMVVTNDESLAEKIRVLRNHGIEAKSSDIDFVEAGFNYRMNEIEAILGIVQMKEINNIVSERQKLAEFYIDSFKTFDRIAFQRVLPDASTSWQAFVVRIKNGDNKHILKLLSNSNIESNIGTYALHLLSFYYKKYGYKPSDYPNAAELYHSSVALPFFNRMTTESIEEVSNTLRRIVYEDRTY